ncbi:MAG: nucleotidyltransferase domain-containing protein [Nanoarchaeota archaeon]|nr:nucleotidyltransferase domain-containing protein [Nanoarchaeota archaeon]MCG2719212.1 nucleotidyltransferase domain-containing protein [Nanoarchaeota archaeon]
MQELLKKALEEIKLSKTEEKKLLKIAKAVIKKIKIGKAKSVLGGSAAKSTWLQNNHDIDIYVKFDLYKYKNENISEILKKELVKKFGKVELLHGSRDYFQIKEQGYDIEIVPILKIKNATQALNITDISPLHVKWVRKHRKLADEMRLAKTFFKANKLYGAESYIKGFSGYVLEILVAYYGSFASFVTDLARWDNNSKKIIDVEGYYIGKDILQELNVAKVVSPLILIDPVQKERNAAAGVGKQTFSKVINLANEFLSKPSIKYFVKQTVTKNSLNKGIVLEVVPLEGKKDVVGAKLLKCFEYIKQGLRKNDFIVEEADWEYEDKTLFWFKIKQEKLSKSKKHLGPFVKDKESVKHFKQVWKGSKVLKDKDRVYVMKKRKYLDPKKLIKDLIKTEYIKEKVKGVKL